jgi:predicted MFS family arabinose efflux permease
MVLTAAAFPLCGLAPSYPWLLAARALQGVGAGLIYGTAPALITLAVEREQRGPGIGILNLSGGAALAIAPAIAGVLIERYGWRSVFLFRAPLALALLAFTLSKVAAAARPGRRAAASGAIPPLSMPILAADAAAFLANAAFFVLYLLGPYYLVDVLGVSATGAGLLFMLIPLGTTVGGLAGGFSVRRMPPGILVVVGLVLQALGLVLLGAAGGPPSISRTAIGFAVAGLGLGAFQVTNMATVMALVPDATQGFGGGMISAMRTVGIIAAAFAAPRLFESRRSVSDPGRALGDVFIAATLVTLAALGLFSLAAWRRRRRPRSA